MDRRLQRIERYRMLFAIALSLAIVFVIIFFVSNDPFGAITSFVLGPVQSLRRIGNIVELLIPFMMAGLTTILLFKTGLFNLSAEGAIFSGSVIATILALTLKLPPILVLIIAILVAGVLGATVSFIPGFLRVKTGASEIVTSLMLNFVCLNIGLFVIQNYFQDEAINSPYSYKFPKGMELGNILHGTRIHYGLIIALLFIAIAWYILKKTAFGYKTDLVGANVRMAEYSGIKGDRIILITQLMGGFVAGTLGAVELFGMYNRFQYSDLTGYGWDGIPIAIIAKNDPKLLPFAALFLSYLRIGADIMSRETDIPFEIVQVIQAIMIIFISAQALLSGMRKRALVKSLEEKEEV